MVTEFKNILDEATSLTLNESDWNLNMVISDLIHENKLSTQVFIDQIIKKLELSNKSSLFALIILETVMKNCWVKLGDQILKSEVIDACFTLALNENSEIKNKSLFLIEIWHQCFKTNRNFRLIDECYSRILALGIKFPVVDESEVFFFSEMAPEWCDGVYCFKCKVKFTTFTRKHHCRSCGEVFCAKCSVKSIAIPKFGYIKDVRVCDKCYEDLTNSSSKNNTTSSHKTTGTQDLPIVQLKKDSSMDQSDKKLREKEEEDIQLAIALSLDSIENERHIRKEMSRDFSLKPNGKNDTSKLQNNQITNGENQNNVIILSSNYPSFEKSDETFKKIDYVSEKMNHQYKNDNNNNLNSDAMNNNNKDNNIYYNNINNDMVNRNINNSNINKINENNAFKNSFSMNQTNEIISNTHGANDALDCFVSNFNQSYHMFLDRLENARLMGRQVSEDSTVQALFHALMALHPQIIAYKEQLNNELDHYNSLLNRIEIVHEARRSLKQMVEQHQQKIKEQQIEQEIFMKMQMEQKMQLMQQQKQEALAYQKMLEEKRLVEIQTQESTQIKHSISPVNSGHRTFSSPVHVIDQNVPFMHEVTTSNQHSYSVNHVLPKNEWPINYSNLSTKQQNAMHSSMRPLSGQQICDPSLLLHEPLTPDDKQLNNFDFTLQNNYPVQESHSQWTLNQIDIASQQRFNNYAQQPQFNNYMISSNQNTYPLNSYYQNSPTNSQQLPFPMNNSTMSSSVLPMHVSSSSNHRFYRPNIHENLTNVPIPDTLSSNPPSNDLHLIRFE